MEGNEFIAAHRAQPALLAAALSGSLHMCQSSFAKDIIINPCERWQMKTTGIKVHHIITQFSVKLPHRHPHLWAFSVVILTSHHLQPCPPLAYFLLVYPSKQTFSSGQLSQGTCPLRGELEKQEAGVFGGFCPHFPFFPYLFTLYSAWHLSFTLYVPLSGLPTTKSNM